MAALQGRGVYTLGPVYSVMVLILVFVGVTAGSLIAAGAVAAGFRLPAARTVGPEVARSGSLAESSRGRDAATPSRAMRTAAAAAALAHRDAAVFGGGSAGAFERRAIPGALSQSRWTTTEALASPPRLGQGSRRPGRVRDSLRSAP